MYCKSAGIKIVVQSMLTEATLQNCKIFPNSIINQCAEFLSLITFQTTGCVTQLCLPGLYFYLTNA